MDEPPLSVEAIDQKIDGWVKFVAKAEGRDQVRWKSAPDRLQFVYADEVKRLKEMLKDRIGWLDANMPAASDPIVFP